MTKPNSKHEILVGITGRTTREIKNKILECQNLGIKRVSLFLEFISEKRKRKIFEFLLDSKIKEIPFVHLRNDMTSQDIKFLEKNFNAKYFNIHTNSFLYLEKWKGYYNKILLELSYRDQVPDKKAFNRLAGFCIDLSHLKCAKEKGKLEWNFVMSYKKKPELFIANHLNGFSRFRKKDLHTVKKPSQLDYLKDLPGFVFGKYIVLEMFNPIHEQLMYKEYIKHILKNKINIK